MTEDFPLPPDLERLEQRLAARARPEPPPRAKERWLCHVQAELRQARAGGRWAFALATAAAVLIWLNVSWCATQATDCGLGRGAPPPSLEEGAEQIRQLLPELPPREAIRQSVLLRSGSGLVPCPRVSAGRVAMAKGDEWKELLN